MKIQVIGPGCVKCQRLAAHVEQAARELDIESEIDKVSSLDQILAMGVVRTPGLAIDGEVVSSGRVPSVARIKDLLKGASSSAAEEIVS